MLGSSSSNTGTTTPPVGTKSPGSSTSDLTRDPEFWLEDGNIVLVARNIAFRIYRGLISKQSQIFYDMFASSSAGTMLFDNCPTVHLSYSPEDLRYLLRVLVPVHCRRVYTPPSEDAPSYTFNQLFALTTLAHKYRITDIQEQALCCIQSYYSIVSFDRWEQWDDSLFQVDLSLNEAIGAVKVSYLLDVPCMLPLALYGCAVAGGKLLNGWIREDGSVEHLDQIDLKRCINAYGSFSRTTMNMLDCVFAPVPISNCAAPANCPSLMTVMHRWAMELDLAVRILHSWQFTGWGSVTDVEPFQ
ncbi:hypothetical protein C8Q80DRAFT_1275281 [Daedaleopsis nitida]|nr:hypothetical protein C8Q80DRAFT_1275281 [Daedaleopsis nitida]